ncbi:MAG: hypothetical protein HKL80_06375 [Acidimicrobiales bacterium]|nr:hypothetical protein [Acidimicrobiales bacterium]
MKKMVDQLLPGVLSRYIEDLAEKHPKEITLENFSGKKTSRKYLVEPLSRRTSSIEPMIGFPGHIQ